jgi:hypothetical protein
MRAPLPTQGGDLHTGALEIDRWRRDAELIQEDGTGDC